MEHPLIQHLKERRSTRNEDAFVLWKELDLIIQLLEDSMEGIAATEAALAQLKSDSEARDAATTTALTDLKAEVAALESTGVDTTKLNATISALDAAVKTGTTEAQAADPGAQTQPSPPASATTEQVSVSVGEAGEGSAVVDHAPGVLTVSAASSGSATVSAVEGNASQAKVTVTGATPNTTVEVTLQVAA